MSREHPKHGDLVRLNVTSLDSVLLVPDMSCDFSSGEAIAFLPFSKDELAIIIDTQEEHGKFYHRILTPHGMGWIHERCLVWE